MMIDKCVHLDYFDPADGYVPNPGMGTQGYVFSDHMHYGYSKEEFSFGEHNAPNEKLSRQTFERMMRLPYCDNLYFRVDWNKIQKEPGKLCLTEEWEWLLDEVNRSGRRWSLRVMNASRHNNQASSVPDFLLDKLPMIGYESSYQFGPKTKFYPAYTSEYMHWWDELIHLLADRFDGHPGLEFVDISGYGIWGEGHHYGRLVGAAEDKNNHADNAEAIIQTLITQHERAFAKTPVAMTLHFIDYQAGMDVVKNKSHWLRRDSFQTFSSVWEYDAVADPMPGRAIIWETLLPMMPMKPPIFTRDRVPQRMLDMGAHYVAMGFNPWDAIIDHRYFMDTYNLLNRQIGYRIRPSILWRRINEEGGHELVLALVNDGCVAPPGTLTLTAEFPGGGRVSIPLPPGAPEPGSKTRYTVPMPRETWALGVDTRVHFRLSLRMKGKEFPVRWAVGNHLDDPFVLDTPLRIPPNGDPFTVRAEQYAPVW